MDIITAVDLAPYPTGADDCQLEFAAERASALVNVAWSQAASGVEPPAWVQAIAVEAALRWLYNPKGLESFTVALDDASRTERSSRSRLGTGYGLSLTPDEERRLAGRVKGGQVGSMGLRVPGFR